jgi:Isochorismatase family
LDAVAAILLWSLVFLQAQSVAGPRGVTATNQMEYFMIRNLTAAAVVAIAALTTQPSWAADIVDEWASIKPPAPTLKEVTVDPKTTALLMLDFMKQNCGQRPRCMATLPAMKKLLAAARAAKVPVIYSIIANSTPADVLPDVAVSGDEPHVLAGPDKFRGTDLEKILKDKGITTVITVGTAAMAPCFSPQPARHSAA